MIVSLGPEAKSSGGLKLITAVKEKVGFACEQSGVERELPWDVLLELLNGHRLFKSIYAHLGGVSSILKFSYTPSTLDEQPWG